MVIGGTTFQLPHNGIHKTTRVSSEMKTKHQIGHITIARRWKKIMTSVRAYRGVDHKLVAAKLKIKITVATRQDQIRSESIT